MKNRTEKIKELIENFQTMKRRMVFTSRKSGVAPRVTPSQWGVLMLIQERGESTVKNIAELLNITSSAATQLVGGLVESGYVLRREHKKDRRAVSLILSKKTSTHVETMKKESLENYIKFFAVLNDAEFDQYVALSNKITKDVGV